MEDIRTGVCPLCQHNEVIRAVPTDAGENGQVHNLAVARGLHTMLGVKVGSDNAGDPRGVLLVYTCRECGFSQWFAQNPAEVPIGKEFRTSLITGPLVRKEPYR